MNTVFIGPGPLPENPSYHPSHIWRGGPRGEMRAFNLSDGTILWKQHFSRPPNNLPVIGRLAGRSGLSLVQPIGQQEKQGESYNVYAFDAATGEQQWIFKGPTQVGIHQAMSDLPPEEQRNVNVNCV